MLAYTAGIMVAASAYGLIPSALKLSNIIVLVIGRLIGTFILTILESLIPHVDLEHSRKPAHKSSVIILFLIAMSLHNLPEGLSVGISNISNEQELGALVFLAIGLQNVPDGFLGELLAYIIPYGLAFAAGSMLFVVYIERHNSIIKPH